MPFGSHRSRRNCTKPDEIGFSVVVRFCLVVYQAVAVALHGLENAAVTAAQNRRRLPRVSSTRKEVKRLSIRDAVRRQGF
jgi:hypothetical protein